MKLKVCENPKIIKEISLMFSAIIDPDYNEDEFVSIENIKKYDFSKLDTNERYKDYFQFRKKIISLFLEKVKENKNINKFYKMKIGEDQLSFLSKILLNTNIEDVNELDIYEFKKSSLLSLILNSDLETEYSSEDLVKKVDLLIDKDLAILDILPFIKTVEMDSEDKFLLIEFFEDIDNIFFDYLEVISFASNIYNNNYKSVEKYVLNSLENLKINGKYPENFKELSFAKRINIHDKKGEDSEMLYYISLIEYRGMSLFLSPINHIKPVIREGIFFKYLLENTKLNDHKKERLKEVLISLGDKTRLEILLNLMDREYYLKELSDKLDLTSPTVSHHIQILLNNELIKIRTEGRKIFYSINKDKFIELSEIFKDLGDD